MQSCVSKIQKVFDFSASNINFVEKNTVLLSLQKNIALV